jgi:hypothetical protein
VFDLGEAAVLIEANRILPIGFCGDKRYFSSSKNPKEMLGGSLSESV